MGLTTGDLVISGILAGTIVFLYKTQEAKNAKHEERLTLINQECSNQRKEDAATILGLHKAVTKLSESVGYLKGLLAHIGNTSPEPEEEA
ncbi:hypothetical protein UFOVP380_9 [uncultured Caudovirales phage]|uniref:Holin n=1 Tax=uncultured Caudovirales phage TaxID=2100421 RepID=A0A6J7WZC6_9CAUD|nr:hypothetical protein UFOVP380_9 [uncultured Caudovirales phage]